VVDWPWNVDTGFAKADLHLGECLGTVDIVMMLRSWAFDGMDAAIQ
jgi:hypothetical protein